MRPYGMAIWPEEHYLTPAPTLEPRAPGYAAKPGLGICPDMKKSSQQCTSSAWKVTKVRKGTSNASAAGGSTFPQQLMRFWLSRNQGEL